MAKGTLAQLLPAILGAVGGAVAPDAGRAGVKTLAMADDFRQRKRQNEMQDERMTLAKLSSERAGLAADRANKSLELSQRASERADAAANRSEMLWEIQYNSMTPVDPEVERKKLKPGEYARVPVRGEGGQIYHTTISGGPVDYGTTAKQASSELRKVSNQVADVQAAGAKRSLAGDIAQEQRVQRLREKGEKDREEMPPETPQLWDPSRTTRGTGNEGYSGEFKRGFWPFSKSRVDIPPGPGVQVPVPRIKNTPAEQKTLQMSDIAYQQEMEQLGAILQYMPPELQALAMEQVMASLGQGITGAAPAAGNQPGALGSSVADQYLVASH